MPGGGTNPPYEAFQELKQLGQKGEKSNVRSIDYPPKKGGKKLGIRLTLEVLTNLLRRGGGKIRLTLEVLTTLLKKRGRGARKGG